MLLELYRIQRKYQKRRSEDELDEEDYLLLDPEASPLYDHTSCGTVTVEGFGLEYWGAEKVFKRVPHPPGPNRGHHGAVPDLTWDPATLLCRIDGVRHATHPAEDPKQQIAAIIDCVGSDVWRYFAGSSVDAGQRILRFLYAYHHEQGDVSELSILSQLATEFEQDRFSGGPWPFWVLMAMSRELALRLALGCTSTDSTARGRVAGLTASILASLILSERWLQNTEIYLGPPRSLRRDVRDAMARGVTEQERTRAKHLIRRAEEANDRGDITAATDLYKDAVWVNIGNYEPAQARAEWLLTIPNYKGAASEAAALQLMDPSRLAGHIILGKACMGYKNYTRAQDAFQKAADLAESVEEKAPILEQLASAEAASSAELQAIEQEGDEKRKRALVRDKGIADWDPWGKTIGIRPTKHQQQLDGLFLFAERMKWPYLAEARASAEKSCQDWLELAEPLYYVQMDWLFAVVLPGQRFAHLLMTTLIYSTPTLEKVMAMSLSPETGLVLPECSYWRTRSVLGRVFAGLPGVTALNGWVGPCPVGTLDTPGDETPPAHCLVTTWHFNPASALLPAPTSDSPTDPLVDGKQNLAQLRQITDQSGWITLVPPTCESTDPAWNMEPFTLHRWEQHDPNNPKSIWLWTAALEFVQEGESGNRIKFQLDFNPVFVTLPACSLAEGETVHRVHRRELERYKTKHVSVLELMHLEPRADDRGEVIVINAMAPGAEVVARAWCAQYGRAAIIRKAEGACFSCAIKAASKYGLRVEILIWVS
jgi:tetratricopeptide (TPR) repeat protein